MPAFKVREMLKGPFIMFGVSPWHCWLPALTSTNMLARTSQLVKGSREHSRNAKLLGLVQLAKFFVFAEELGGAEDVHAL